MNYLEWYNAVSARFRSPGTRVAMRCMDRALVYFFALAFVLYLSVLVANADMRAVRFALVPAIVFALVTVARARIDEPRPYEAYPIDPIIEKDTKGKSMPSRHMASATIISFAFAWIDWRLGIAALVACALVAFTRIVGGVHYPRDIVAAVAISTACGIIGFVLVP